MDATNKRLDNNLLLVVTFSHDSTRLDFLTQPPYKNRIIVQFCLSNIF